MSLVILWLFRISLVLPLAHTQAKNFIRILFFQIFMKDDGLMKMLYLTDCSIALKINRNKRERQVH